MLLPLLGLATGSVAQDGPGSHLPYRFVGIEQVVDMSLASRNAWVRQYQPCGVVGQVGCYLKTNTLGPRLHKYLAGSFPVVWMEPYPGVFNGEDASSSVDGVWRFRAGGEPEAVFHVFDPSRSRLLIERRRVRDGKLTARFELASGPDRNGDGTWDGQVRVAGVLEVPTPSGPRQALVMLCRAAYDLEPRGVRVVDASTGEPLWDYLVGPPPGYDDIAIRDLDGDARPEIVFGGRAVGNMHAESFHGTRDDTSRVFVLDASGRLLWSRAFAPYSASIQLQVADVRGDSLPEILVGSYSGTAANNGLCILDGKGALLDSLQISSGVRGLGVIPDPPRKARILIKNRGLEWMKVDGGPGLVVLARRSLPEGSRLAGVADLAPEPGPEILVGGDSRCSTWLLSRDLEPLAYLAKGKMQAAEGGLTEFNFREGGSPLKVLRSPVGAWKFSIERSPRRIPWGLMGGVLAVGLAVPAVRRLRRGNRPSETTRRELQLQLLGRLELSGHGAIGGLSAVRRLVWNLDALAQGFTLGEERREVMQGLLAEIRENQIPKLHAAVELARLGGLDPGRTDLAADQLAELEGRLDAAAGGLGSGSSPLSLAQGLKDAAEGAESSFQGLRREVEKAFRIEPERFVSQALEARREALGTAGVKVEARLEGLPACGMDGEEFAFVVDNLIENALRAMRGGKDPRLTIDWKDGGNYCTLRFADTGCGIVPDDWQRIFEAGQSSRSGGGLGLPRSRELLRKFGGGLMVESSALGRGTIMALTLRVMNP